MVLVFALLICVVIVVLFFYMGMLLWMIFSPDYLLVIGFSGIFTMDHMGWLTSSEKAQFIWGVVAMVVVGFAYYKLNHLLYSVSQRIYAIVSFPIVVVSSLILMLTFVLKMLEEVATIEHAICIVLALVIAVFAWRKRQTAMARLHSPANIVLTNGNVMVVESGSAMPTSPYTPPATPPTPAPGAFPPPAGKPGFKNY